MEGIEAIISHQGVDFDGLASMVAAGKLYPRARLYFTGSPEQGVRDFMNLYRDLIRVENPKNPSHLNIKKIILVDCRNPNRLGDFRYFVNNPQVEVHIYDHHPPSLQDVRGDVNVIEEVGASTTILMEMIINRKIYLSPLEATLMALGIYEETGSMLFKSTTPRDAMAVADLLGRGVNLQVVSDYIFQFLNDEQRRMLNQLLISARVIVVKGFRILVAKGRCDHYMDGLAMVTHRLQDLERMDAVFSIVEMADRIYMVARSVRSDINVSTITRFFGGGGHTTASSAVIKNMSLSQVENRLRNVLRQCVTPMVKARDIMSSPVHTIQLTPGFTLNDAYDFMHRVGHFNLPVLKGEKLAGIVDRRDVDKARSHKYGNALLEVYMSSPVRTASPDMSIHQMQDLMMKEGIGCLPVIDGNRLVGIVTRSDVLEAVYQRDISAQQKKQRPLDRIKKLPRFVRDLLKSCGRVGDRLKMAVFVVGGFVRDLLMGVENLDIDLVVEGDGMLFGETLAETLKGRVRIHEKFGTSTVSLPGGLHIDVATSRTEYYTRPAALPEVMESSVKQDLYRRDFTINAMAIRLNRKFFGELLDFFGCRRDLKNGIVRVLHPLSFVDDPTRILRAVKFEQRYHFRMDQSTENLLKDALSSDIFREITAERIRNELIEILEEPRPLPAIKRMEQLRILRLIHKDIHLDSRMVEVIESITATLVQFDKLAAEEDVRRWVLYFNALVMRLDVGDVEKIAEKFRVAGSLAARIGFDRDRMHRIIHTLCSRSLKVSEIYRTLQGLSMETLLFIMARSRTGIVGSRVLKYIKRLRHTEPVVTGHDLIRWGLSPGPRFKDVLGKMFDAQLDSEFDSLEGACEYFRREFHVS